jgi:hypothetical protein
MNPAVYPKVLIRGEERETHGKTEKRGKKQVNKQGNVLPPTW